jgi:hypothetical protein
MTRYVAITRKDRRQVIFAEEAWAKAAVREGWIEGYLAEEYTPEPEPTDTERQQNAALAARKERLLAIDALSVRPLRAIVEGSGTEADARRLAELEKEARELRGADC